MCLSFAHPLKAFFSHAPAHSQLVEAGVTHSLTRRAAILFSAPPEGVCGLRTLGGAQPLTKRDNPPPTGRTTWEGSVHYEVHTLRGL